KEIFILGDEEKIIPISSCSDADCKNMVNGGILSVTVDGEEIMLAHCSMTIISRFFCLAKGIKWLCEGKLDKRVENHDKEKYCAKCGRVLPGTNHCPKCDKEHHNFRRLLTICKPYTASLVVIISLMLLGSAIDLAVQFVLRYFVDGYLVTGKGTALNVLVFFAVYFGITLISSVGYLYRTYLCNKLGIGVSTGLRAQLNEHIQKLSLSFLDKRNPGAVIERVMNDTYHVRSFICDCFCNMFGMLVTLVSLAVLMLILNWKLALAAFAFAPLIIIFARTFWPKIRRIFHNQSRRADRIQNKLQDVLSGIRIVKTYGKEKEEVEEFCKLNDKLASVQRSNEVFFAIFFPFLSLLLAFGTYLITYLGGMGVLEGSMTVGELMQFIAYAGMLLGPLSWMSFLPRRIINMTTSLERIYDILDEVPNITNKENAIKKEIEGNIDINNITFGYNSYDPVVENLTLNVKKGEMIGLVGSSGCGKSTLINLIMRLYDVDEGEILIDGHNIKDIDLTTYHSSIGVVLQETFLFAGTVLDNIRFANPAASMLDIIKAAKSANAHEFICKLPDGYNTYIGEKGHMLSGGEKQRIAIARAILTNPKILILDEATSALDTESEYQIQEAFERLRKGRTTFAIAHRLSTLRNADRIAVINEKSIQELGTHNELLKLKGIYYGLVMAQLEMNKNKE
ncbi:MAG: ABC transporter ATP-binding protein, partial [Clostridia bacterium]|nr:ABC transporter ATP-binding protein [Clostridia bacterium]